MGFGSGGGGFTPSPNNVPGSTTTGTDKDTDTHQFTGSVDITGSLTLNGSSITGGGGGGTPGGSDTQVQYNDAGSFAGSSNLVFDGTTLTANQITSPQVTASVSMKAAILEVSSSAEGALFRVDHSTQVVPTLFVTGSGRVGIGTDDPSHLLHLQSSGKASLLLEADTDNTPETDTAYIKLTQDGAATRMILGLNGNASADPDGVYLANAISNAGIVGPRTAGSPLQLVTSNRAKICVQDDGQVGIGDGFNESTRPSAILHVSGGIQAQGTAKASPLILVEYDDNDNILFVTGSGRVGIGTGTPLQTLSVSGSAAFSGTYGSTAIETRAANLETLNATDGVAIINLTSAAVNTSFTFLIDNGTYTGQEKIVYFKTIIGADGANSNDATLQGTNIDSPLGNATGLLSLSGSDPGSGFVGLSRGAARLLWDGTDWAPISVTNLSWN